MKREAPHFNEERRSQTVKNNWSYLPVIIFVSCGQRDGCLCG